MVVLFIFAAAILLARAILPKPGSPKPTKLGRATAQLFTFKTQLRAFRIDNGFYPTGTNGLRALIRQPTGATNWHGRYAVTIPKDPWGRNYVYECPGKHTASGYPYDLSSLGPPGADKPIANWNIPKLAP